MADERDEQEPKIKIIDHRASAQNTSSDAPKLEIVGGFGQQPAPTSQAQAPQDAQNILDQDDFAPDELQGEGEEIELTEEEAAQLQEQFENEQFAQVEAQLGRPLTNSEKQQVRQEMERQAQEMSRLDVAPILQNTMAELSARAAIHMGLMPNPYTRLIARNDTQARIAIDAFGALYEVLRPSMPPQLAQEYARVLNDLRVNFGRISGQNITGPSRIIR